MATKKKKAKKEMTGKEARVAKKGYKAARACRRTQTEQERIDQALDLRNAGMTAKAAAEAMGIEPQFLYRTTSAIPAYARVEDIAEFVHAGRSIGLNLMEYLFFIHSEFGVDHVLAKGQGHHVKRMLEIANAR